MREKKIENALREAILVRGGMAIKLVSPSMNGMPDRLVLMPYSKMGLIELKATGKTMRPLQIKRREQLRALGFKTYCIDRIEQIGGVLDEIQSS